MCKGGSEVIQRCRCTGADVEVQTSRGAEVLRAGGAESTKQRFL